MPTKERAADRGRRRCRDSVYRLRLDGRMADGQALERRLALKLRDDPEGHLILLVAETRTNRAVLRSISSGLTELLPNGTRDLLAALAAGRDPGASGIAFM